MKIIITTTFNGKLTTALMYIENS